MAGMRRDAAMVFASVITTMALVGAVAIATGVIPGADGVIHGCYDQNTGSLRVVADTTDCRRNEFALQWNQSGPRGPSGPQGASGAKGDTGATGPAGTLASFDALIGLPCNVNGAPGTPSTPGTIQIDYGFLPLETVTLTCAVTGPADHLTCRFSPTPIIADGAAISTATVRVRDAAGLTVTAGAYSVTLDLQATTVPGGSTTLVTTNPQLTVNGVARFTVRATTNTGIDTFAPSITPGSSPTLPNSFPNGSCAISVVSSL
jgi:hypothetical protein